MKYSSLFGKTRLNAPHDATSANARLLTQAGFIERLSAGIYNILPLGLRSLKKITNIIREEMNAVGGQELLMPALQTTDIWETTGRNKTMDDVLYRTKGVGNKEFVLGATHEEAVTPLVTKFLQSYKDLPLAVYQFQTKFRDEPRAKSGILRGREFGMKDMYSFHVSREDLNDYYEKVKDGYLKVFKRCGLKAYVVEASGGAFSEDFSHEFSVITPAGEDTIIINKKDGTAQNSEVATGKIVELADKNEDEKPLAIVEIERDLTVAANAEAHSVEDWRILKTVVYKAGDGFIGVCIRGDLQVNEDKLTNYLGKQVRAATQEELKSLNLVQGYISPYENDKVPFIADHSIKNVKNFVTGANEYGKDVVNFNLGRDFTIEEFTDLVLLDAKSLDENGDHEVATAVEAGNIFKLNTKYSDAFNLKYTDEDGSQKPVYMGCYGIGTTRLLGTIVEASHDENGIIWPKSVAPFHVHLVTLGNDDEIFSTAETIYNDLESDGIEVLYDDRNESAGKKLKDADLIGCALRIVLSKRTMAEASVEWKERATKESKNVKIENLKNEVHSYLQ